MANTAAFGLSNDVPTHNYIDWSVAKNYFMYRRNLDRTSVGQCDHYYHYSSNRDDEAWKHWCSDHHRADSELVFMPPHVSSKNWQVSNKFNLLGLPGELISNIADHLAPIDLLSYRTACRDTRSLTATKRTQARLHRLPIEALDEHAWKIRKDCFTRMAEYENSNNTPYGKLLCSYCMDLHPISSFSATEVSKHSTGSAYRRRCTASQAKVYLCPHMQLSFENLNQLCRGPTGRLVCALCSASCSSGSKLIGASDHCSLSQRIYLPMASNKYLWPMLGCFPIRCDSFSAKSTILSTLRKVVQNADMYICPHIQIRDRTCKMLGNMIEGALLRPSRKHSSFQMASYKATRFSGCEKTGCIAGVEVILEQHGITIEAIRRVKVTTVTAENWLVSTQSPVADARV